MDNTLGDEPTRTPERQGHPPRSPEDLSRAGTHHPTPPPSDTLDDDATADDGPGADSASLDDLRTLAPGSGATPEGLTAEKTRTPSGVRRGSNRLFAEIALEWKLLTRDQVEDLRVTFDKLAQVGMPRSFAQICREKKMLPEEDVRRILREMRKRGASMRIGGFEILGKLGEGGMGAVYKAKQVSLDRIVALKTLRREISMDARFIERFQREARLASRVRHPNAVQVYSTGKTGHVHYIVMEYVNGATVTKLVRSGPMDERQALAIVRGVAAALAVAHEEGIIHRDIKPDNIMVTRDGVPKLMDLGIAREYGAHGDTITQTGRVVGSPHYMSPEQCEGKADLDARSDIYSLGVTLFHMVCGARPFDGETSRAIMEQHRSARLPDPKSLNPRLSDGVAELLRRVLAKLPDSRPSDCSELVSLIDAVRSGAALGEETTTQAGQSTAELAALAQQEATPSGTESAIEAAKPAWKPPVWFWLAVAVGAVLLGGAMIVSNIRQKAAASRQRRELLSEAAAAARGKDWATAVRKYEQSLKQRPDPATEKKLSLARYHRLLAQAKAESDLGKKVTLLIEALRHEDRPEARALLTEAALGKGGRARSAQREPEPKPTPKSELAPVGVSSRVGNEADPEKPGSPRKPPGPGDRGVADAERTRRLFRNILANPWFQSFENYPELRAATLRLLGNLKDREAAGKVIKQLQRLERDATKHSPTKGLVLAGLAAAHHLRNEPLTARVYLSRLRSEGPQTPSVRKRPYLRRRSDRRTED